jgi:hypothetical protein
VGRIVIGSSILLATRHTHRLFGIGSEHDTAALRVMSRLFGIRDVVLGVWALSARDRAPASRRVCYRVNAAVDAADLVALLIGAASGEGLVRAAVMAGAFGGVGLVSWLELVGDVLADEARAARPTASSRDQRSPPVHT